MHFIYIWYNVIHIENKKFFHRKPSIYAVYISYPQFVDNLWIICQHNMDKMLKNAVMQKNKGL